jgi:hypothetical protein
MKRSATATKRELSREGRPLLERRRGNAFFDVYRNGTELAAVCEAGGSAICSNEATVSF